MFKFISQIFKPAPQPVSIGYDLSVVHAATDAKIAGLLPKELQGLTLEQWRSFIKEAAKPEEPVDQPQTVEYTLADGTIVVVAGVVPPLTLVDGSASEGYVVLSDKLGNRRQVSVVKPSIPQDS